MLEGFITEPQISDGYCVPLAAIAETEVNCKNSLPEMRESFLLKIVHVTVIHVENFSGID